MKVDLVCSVSAIPGEQVTGVTWNEQAEEGIDECWENSCCLGLGQVILLYLCDGNDSGNYLIGLHEE